MKTVNRSTRPAGYQAVIRCAFCQGRGTDPFCVMSERSVCSSCQGTCEVTVPVPHVRCAYCGGSGSYKTYRCSVCSGTGVVPETEGPTIVCPECRGRAADASSGLACLRCHGRGIVPDKTGEK